MRSDHGGIRVHVNKLHFGANMARIRVTLSRDVREPRPEYQEEISLP